MFRSLACTLSLAILVTIAPVQYLVAEENVETRPALEKGDPATEGINPDALKKLVARAEAANSDALVILKNGKLIGEWYFGKEQGPIEAMSATKSVVSLAIGRLIDDGKIPSVDEPVCTFFQEWKQGRKKLTTLRHLLNHTSGLQNERTTDVEIYPSPDFVKLALAAELSDEPGTRFAYNNKAANLLAGVVKVASGKRMDEYLGAEVFAPLGITDFSWTLDRAGNPHAMSGLQIRALDLAKIGQMMLDGGKWNGRQVISETWITESTKPGQKFNPNCGLLWWLIQKDPKFTITDANLAEWRKAGVEEAFIQKVAPLKDQVFGREEFFAALSKTLGGDEGLETWYNNTWRRGLSDGTPVPGEVQGYQAQGYLGQYLVVLTEPRLVAVRQIRSPRSEAENAKLDPMQDFVKLVLELPTK